MIKIHKQRIQVPFDTYVQLNLPKGSKILDIQPQDSIPCIWYEFEYEPGEEVQYRPREFVLRATGRGFERIPSSRPEHGVEVHLGTCLTNNGRLVYHIYEVR